MSKTRNLLLVFGILMLMGQAAYCAAPGKTLWIAKFQCDTKAAQAVAAVQQGDTSALEYSNLFDRVISFSREERAPVRAWKLEAREVKFSGGNAAMRGLIGFGTGRAHLVMRYELLNPHGKVVWTKEISSKPSFWGSSGAMGAIQNQTGAERKQAQELVEDLQKFMGSNGSN